MTRASCRCRLPLDPPDGRYWLPSQHPDPGPEVVQAVAICGQDPALLRWERVDGGWRCQGAAAVPYETPPKPWDRVGRCWDGTQHPVHDVTGP
jgi:hypothetical protein